MRGIPGERVVLGLFLAACGPPVLIALFMVAVLLADPKTLADGTAILGSFAVIFYGTVIGAFHVLLVGLPLYALLLRWLPHRWWLATLNGFVAGALPWTVLHLSTGRDGRVFEIALSLGAFGAIGGFLFWLVTRRKSTQPAAGSSDVGS